MPNVKRTFTLPDDVSSQLDEVVPNKERSKFIANSLRRALGEHKKQELLEMLVNMPKKKNPEGIKSEDVLGGIRSDRAKEIISNS